MISVNKIIHGYFENIIVKIIKFPQNPSFMNRLQLLIKQFILSG